MKVFYCIKFSENGTWYTKEINLNSMNTIIKYK